MHEQVAPLAEQDDVAGGVGLADVPGDHVMELQGLAQGALVPAAGAFSLVPDGDLGLDVLRDVPGHTLAPDGQSLASLALAILADAGNRVDEPEPPAVYAAESLPALRGHDIILGEKGKESKEKWRQG